MPEEAKTATKTFNWNLPVYEVVIKRGSALLRYSNANYAKGAYFAVQTFTNSHDAIDTLGLSGWNSVDYVYAIRLKRSVLGIEVYEGKAKN